MKLNYNLLLSLVIMFLLTSFNLVAFAEEINLQEAIEQGLNNNIDILDAQDNLESIERGLKQLRAEDDWQLNLTVDGYSKELNFDDDSNDLEFSVSGSRTYWWGLTLESQLYGDGNYSLEDKLSNDEAGLKLTLNQNLYPNMPTSGEQDYIKKQLDLQVAQKQLKEEKEAKIVSWIGDYLNLLRLKEKYELSVEKKELALNNFNEVNAKQEISEASEVDALAAQIELKEAQYSLKEAENNYQQAKKSFYNQLKLSADKELLIKEDSTYLLTLKEIVKKQELNLEDKSRLLDLSITNSVDVFKNNLDQESTQDDFKWSKDEDKADIDLTGTYDINDNEWGVGVTLSYNLFDSGKQKLEEEDLEAKLTTLKREYDGIIMDLSLQLDKLIDQIRLNKSSLESKELSLSKANLEKIIAKEQLNRGLINKWDLKEKKLDLREAQINQQGAEDDLLVNKLELIRILGLVDFEGGNEIEKID